MTSWRDGVLGDLLRGLARNKAYVAAVAALVLLGIIVPGTRTDERAVEAGQAAAGPRGPGTTGAGGDLDLDGDGIPDRARDAAATAAGRGGAGSAAGPGGAGGAAGRRQVQVSAEAAASASCDPETGRVRIPALYAAPCVPAFGGGNGGATHRGVTADEIVVAVRVNPDNPVISAMLIAAGAEDTTEQIRQTRQDWFDLFEQHYETYGRRVRLVYFDARGEPEDDEAGRSDALYVANELGAFAVCCALTNEGFRDELARRGVICLCGGRDNRYFEERAPYLYGVQPSFEQWMGPVAEYVGKRLAGRNAVHAGDPAYHLMERRIGLLYAEPPQGEYNKVGADHFERELARHGGRLADRVSYVQDVNTANEQARTIVSRLRANNITTLVFWGDPLAPIFLTEEATRQRYFPEYVIAGGNLVDTTFFGRTYHPLQWRNAFGVSQLWARPPQAVAEVFHLFNWHHGRPPTAEASYEILYWTEAWPLYTGIHLAGPDLNPQTFRDGLFSFPPSGGGPTTPLVSFGNHGLWPHTDWTAFDDVTEVWWNPDEVGEDEIGNVGAGMLRYVDGARRYRAGGWPATDPKVFVMDGSVSKFDELPPEDQYPQYPPPQR